MKPLLSRRFRQYIETKDLCSAEDSILLAVSGGVDSVVMAHLFHHCGFHFAMAHCNFGLRDKEADADEAFVRSLADHWGVQFFSTKFETKAYAGEKGISIQMAARELRYDWFAQLVKEQNFDYLATAHHKDDVAETVLLNLTKGSVLQGLQGIPAKAGHIIRPLLFCAKEEIQAYAREYNIAYRDDASNASNKYQRNLIRNEVLPLLKEINPGVVETLASRAVIREELQDWIAREAEKLFHNLFRQRGNVLEASISSILRASINAAVLYEVLAPYGFTHEQLTGLMDSLESKESKVFLSQAYRLVKERESIIIEPIDGTIEPAEVAFHPGGEFTFRGIKYTAEIISTDKAKEILTPAIALLDIDKLQFPLRIRLWASGDSFIPLGMKGKKKLSDFLTDIKASRIEKENQAVVLSGEDIVWVSGKRIDERYKMQPETEKVLLIKVMA